MKNTNTQTIYFDLDGTVYDLYGVSEWLPRITEREDATAYSEGRAFYGDDLRAILAALVAKGYRVGVITWLADGEGYSREYVNAVRAIKRAWVKKHLPMATEVHVVKYGTPKHRVAKTDGILVDDNAEVRAKWNRGATIDASENILPALAALAA